MKNHQKNLTNWDDKFKEVVKRDMLLIDAFAQENPELLKLGSIRQIKEA